MIEDAKRFFYSRFNYYTAKYDKKADLEYHVVKAKKVFNAEKELINKTDIFYIRENI